MTRLSGKERKELAAAIKSDIDAACVKLYDEGHRNHLGASVIGENCNRKLWYIFRWAHKEQFSGRMLRLFNVGHREEAQIITYLEAMGCEVWSHDANGKQFRISDVEGHYGGSLDSVMRLPERYGLTFSFLAEFKTHKKLSFARLVKNGVCLSKPKHHHQMNAYGKVYDLPYAIYFAMCKDDSDLHVEVVALDFDDAHRSLLKARAVIHSATAPARIAASAAFDECKYCSFVGICHSGLPLDVNCRSCRFATPTVEGQWHCGHWQSLIPQEEIPNACPQWTEIEHR
jgi:hypothetical protein